jgi:hypothetical protein
LLLCFERGAAHFCLALRVSGDHQACLMPWAVVLFWLWMIAWVLAVLPLFVMCCLQPAGHRASQATTVGFRQLMARRRHLQVRSVFISVSSVFSSVDLCGLMGRGVPSAVVFLSTHHRTFRHRTATPESDAESDSNAHVHGCAACFGVPVLHRELCTTSADMTGWPWIDSYCRAHMFPHSAVQHRC